MIHQASVRQIRSGELPRENTRIVVAMCHYPRGVKKEWRDDYRKELAPSLELFTDWKKYEKGSGHDEAFILSDYEKRFTLSALAMTYLKIYCGGEFGKDIYFVCQCEVGRRCHREILMLLAREKFGAETGRVFNAYPVFMSRLDEFKVP